MLTAPENESNEGANMMFLNFMPVYILARSKALLTIKTQADAMLLVDHAEEDEDRTLRSAWKALQATIRAFIEGVDICARLTSLRIPNFDRTSLDVVYPEVPPEGVVPQTIDAVREMTGSIAGFTSHVHSLIGLLMNGAEEPDMSSDRSVTVVVEEHRMEVSKGRHWDTMFCRVRHGPADVLAFPLLPGVLRHHDPASLMAAAIISHALDPHGHDVASTQLPSRVMISAHESDDHSAAGCAIAMKNGLFEVALPSGEHVDLPASRLTPKPCLYYFREELLSRPVARLQPAFFQASTQGCLWSLMIPAQLPSVQEQLHNRLAASNPSIEAFLRAVRPDACRVQIDDVTLRTVRSSTTPEASKTNDAQSVGSTDDMSDASTPTTTTKEKWFRRRRGRDRPVTPPSSPDVVAAVLTDAHVDEIARALGEHDVDDAVEKDSKTLARTGRARKLERRRQIQRYIDSLPDLTEHASLLADCISQSASQTNLETICAVRIGKTAKYVCVAPTSSLAFLARQESWNAADFHKWLVELIDLARNDASLVRELFSVALAAK